MKGAYAVFAVTNFFEFMNKDREIEQGKNIADIAKVALSTPWPFIHSQPQELGVKHLIWSSLPHVSKRKQPSTSIR
jgi:hypothetical protein